jgi:hypothetical protein
MKEGCTGNCQQGRRPCDCLNEVPLWDEKIVKEKDGSLTLNVENQDIEIKVEVKYEF